MRAGELVSHEPTSTWDTTISRGTPRLFALLPYRVTGLSTEVTQIADPADAPEDFVRNPDAAASIAPGQTVQLGVRVSAAVRESEHPLAQAVVAYADARNIPRRTASSFRNVTGLGACLLYTSQSTRDRTRSRLPSSA